MKNFENLFFEAIKNESKTLFWIAFLFGSLCEILLRYIYELNTNLIVSLALAIFAIYAFLFKTFKKRYEEKNGNMNAANDKLTTDQFSKLNNPNKRLFFMQSVGLLIAAFIYGWVTIWLIVLFSRSF